MNQQALNVTPLFQKDSKELQNFIFVAEKLQKKRTKKPEQLKVSVPTDQKGAPGVTLVPAAISPCVLSRAGKSQVQVE